MENKYKAILGLLALAGGYFAFGSNGNENIAAAGNAPGNPTATSYRPAAARLSGKAAREENVILSKGNTVVFRSVVTPLSVSKTQQELLDKSDALKSGEPIYLYLDTPGGDISAGNLLIDTARSLGRPVHTITSFAASMGFNIVQRLNKRYITPSGVLMAHRARVEGVGGQIPGEFLTAVGVIYKEVTKMEMQNAARLGISFETYTALVKDEYWVSGQDAIDANAADSIANIKCDESLKGTNVKVFNTIFGPASVTFSNCPAVAGPIDVKFAGGDDRQEVKKLLTSYDLLRKALRGGD